MRSKDETFLYELAIALQNVGLEAIVVGNMASILNGAPVLTQDVDLLVRDTPLNRRKLKRLATELRLWTITHYWADLHRAYLRS